MTMSALEPHAVSSTNPATYDARRTTDLLAKFCDATNGVQRGEWVAARIGWCLWLRPTDPIANIQQDLKEQLLALVGGVEVGHPALVLQRLGAIVGLTVDRVEVVENLLAWPHRSERYRFLA